MNLIAFMFQSYELLAKRTGMACQWLQMQHVQLSPPHISLLPQSTWINISSIGGSFTVLHTSEGIGPLNPVSTRLITSTKRPSDKKTEKKHRLAWNSGNLLSAWRFPNSDGTVPRRSLFSPKDKNPNLTKFPNSEGKVPDKLLLINRRDSWIERKMSCKSRR